MRVFLDDERETPKGWTRCYWPDEVIDLLKKNCVEEVSLDHDLGDDSRGTGYDVILWIEKAVVLDGFVPPKIRIHTSNSSAYVKMKSGVESIERKYYNL